MANDRLELCESTSACSWSSWRKSVHIKDKRGLNLKIHLAVNECGMPIKFVVTDGTHPDYKEAINLIKNINVKLFLVDCASDTNEILFYITE